MQWFSRLAARISPTAVAIFISIAMALAAGLIWLAQCPPAGRSVLLAAIILTGLPIVLKPIAQILRGNFSVDVLAVLSITTSVDELIHIGHRMRSIALQSAIGGMSLSLIGMIAAAFGYLSPIKGALAQEGIDLLSILYSLCMILPTGPLSDFPSAEIPASSAVKLRSHPSHNSFA
jgi:cation transport ATPase